MNITIADTMSILCAMVLLAVIHGAASSSIAAPKQVTGLVGGSITVKCFYSTITKANKYDRKFWCKASPHRLGCSTIVSSSGYVSSEYKHRASISDSPQNNFFLVEMSQLEMADAGYYRCGIGNSPSGLFAVVNVAVSDDSKVPVEAELLYGQLRGQMSIACLFDGQPATERKFLCKMSKTGCRNIIDSTWQVDSEFEGRVMLSYTRTTNAFVFQIMNLRKEDAGHYSCGVGKYGEFGDSREVDLRISEETTIPQGRSVLKAPVGGSIVAECHYDPHVNYSLKYWCKWRKHGCTQLITSNGYVQEAMEGRVTLHDNSSKSTLTILMNQLTEDDAGWYWCAFGDSEMEHRFTMQVQISQGQPGLIASSIVTVAPGNPVSIPCLYPCKYNAHQKYWCKWKSEGCDPVICTEKVPRGLSTSCNRDTREFFLSIPSASLHDEGWYWCGVRKDGRYGETVAVHLKVIEEAHPNEVPPLLYVPHEPEVTRAADKDGRRRNMDVSGDTSPQDSKSSNILPVVLPLCAVVLLVAAAFLIIRLRARKNSDLVSVGSYRTNISLSEMANPHYAGKENAGAAKAQETEIGQGQEEQKNAKKGSKEDLPYMSSLIHSVETST